MTRRTNTDEFRAEAVKLALTSGLSRSQVAEESSVVMGNTKSGSLLNPVGGVAMEIRSDLKTMTSTYGSVITLP